MESLMENNVMEESRIKAIVEEVVSPLRDEVHSLRKWTVAVCLTSIGLTLALMAYATSVFSSHMQSMQLLMSALQ